MSQPHILVLEDDDDVRSMLTAVLQDQGYLVTAVDRGEQAVAKARSQSFDLIIADIRMEGMDGLEAIELAKKEQPELGSLVVSGYASQEETSRANSLQVGGYLRKPFKIQELLGYVRRELAGKLRVERRQEGQDSQKTLLKWALRTATGLAIQNGELEGDVNAASELAGRLARARGLGADVAEGVEIGTLLRGLQGCEAGKLPESLQERVADEISRVLVADDSQESSIAALALCAHAERDVVLDAEKLAARHPGRWDADLLTAYSDAPTEQAPEEERPGSSQSLLALGRTLEQLGDLENALQAYRETLKNSESAQEKSSACLGQARLAFKAGELEKATKFAGQSVKSAQSTGPVAHARALLEAGLLLAEHRHGRALPVLEEASRALASVGQKASQAQAGLALAALSQESSAAPHLEHLFAPENALELSETTRRMMPLLVQHTALVDGPSSLAWLAKLSSGFPQELVQCLRQDQLDVEVKQRVLEALEKNTRVLPVTVLEQLSRDADPTIRKRAVTLNQARGEVNSSAPLLMVHTTGRLEVWLGGEAIPDKDWKTQKVRALFALLASQWGRPFQGEVLTDILWPESGEKGRKNLWWSTSMIRSALRREQDASTVLVRDGEVLRLDADCPHWHDIEELRTAFAKGKKAMDSNELEVAVRHLGRIPSLYRGPYLEGSFFDWALELRRELSRTAIQGMNMLGRVLLSQKRHHQAMEVGQGMLEIQNHSQDAHLLLMRAYLGLGQPEQAMRQFEVCASMLRREFDLEPTIELLEVFHRAKYGIPEG
jgi:two-component SAPR family response regulator